MDDGERQARDELQALRERHTWYVVALVVALVALAGFLVSSFKRSYVTVGTPLDGCTSAEVYHVVSTWWGLRRTSTEIRWMRPTRSAQTDDYEDWCYESSSGEWREYFFYADPE